MIPVKLRSLNQVVEKKKIPNKIPAKKIILNNIPENKRTPNSASEKQKNPLEKSRNLSEKSRGPLEKSRSLSEKSRGLPEKSKSLSEKSKSLSEKSNILPEKSKSLNLAAEKQKTLIMAIEKKKSLKFRITFIQWSFLFVMVLLGMKAIDIQIFKSTDLTMKAEKEYIKKITIEGKRGDIMDRNRKRLTTTIDTVSVAAVPSGITNPALTAKMLSSILKIDKWKLQKLLSTKKNFAWVKRKIAPAEADKIKQLKLTGIFFQDDVIRFHPNRELAAQVIGITGSDSKGLEGLEFRYNDILEGKRRQIQITKDAAGRYYNEEKNIRESLKGDSLVLTIDSTIQFISENALQKAVDDNSAVSGMAIVMQPDTGEILAMAHYPTFNPNSFSDFNSATWRNRAVSDTFEPGSTMKVFVAAAVIENKYVTPKSLFFCENGLYRVGNSTVRDTHKYEWLNVKEIIKYSSNIGAIKLSELMGKKLLSDTLMSFGFGKKTDIDAPGDATGTLSDYKRWSKIDTAAISFGQGMTASAIQLVTGINAIANDGLLVKPRIIKAILSPDGEIRQESKIEPVKQIISKETAIIVRDMMRAVVEEGGTATTAAIDGYSVCGKTGTAQKVSKDGRGYSKDKYTALFVGFAPKNKPKLTVLVVVNEPPRSHYGGVVAAPAVKTIMSECFNYLKIPPDMKTVDEINAIKTANIIKENSNIRKEKTPSEVRKEKTPFEVRKEKTPSEVRKEKTPSEVRKEKTPSEVRKEKTPSEARKEKTLSEVRKEKTPFEARKEKTPSSYKILPDAKKKLTVSAPENMETQQ